MLATIIGGSMYRIAFSRAEQTMKQTITLITCLAFAGALFGQDVALTTARAEYKAMKAEYDSAMDAYYLASRRVSSSPVTAKDHAIFFAELTKATKRKLRRFWCTSRRR